MIKYSVSTQEKHTKFQQMLRPVHKKYFEHL